MEALAASEDNFQSKCCGTEGPVGPTVGRNQRKLPKKKPPTDLNLSRNIITFELNSFPSFTPHPHPSPLSLADSALHGGSEVS